MANKMLIDATHPEETRVVVVRGNRVEEFDYEAASRKQLRGNIYLAKVTRVEPSLQAAFIEYGGNRHGFLAFSEIHPDYYQIPVADRLALIEEEERAARQADEEDERRERRRERSRPRRAPSDESVSGNIEEIDDAEIVDTIEDGQISESDGDEPEEREERRPRSRRGRRGDSRGERNRGEETGQQDTGDHAQTETAGDDDHDAVTDTQDEPRSQTESGALSDEALPAPQEQGEGPAERQDTEREIAAEAPDGEREDAPVFAASEAQISETSDSRDDEGDDEEDEDEDEDGEDEDEGVEQMGSADAMEEVPQRAPQRRARTYKIQEVIRRRQVMLVQVVKEERGNKGAALTTYLSLAGRYSVLMPNTARGGGISRKITNAVDRKRLKEVVQDLEVPEGMGIILRTAGANRTKVEIKRDFEYLLRLWETVRELTLTSSAPSLVYEEGSLIKRAIRDLFNKDIDDIHVAGDAGFREARDFMRMLMPSHVKNVIPYNDHQPIFAKHGVEHQLDAMFSPIVQLKSGGYIVINPTEALVSIDVNSGRSTREHHIEDTALKTNMEASEEIARQLRLRDLAGLIVIDFIDMEEKRNNRSVERKLKDCLKNDRARIQVGRISHFGLMEMSRQRIRTGVLESSIEVCPTCGGTGHVRSAASVALQLLRALEEQLLRSTTHNLVARTRGEVALYVLNQKRAHLRELEERFSVTLIISADESVTGHQPFLIDKGEIAVPPPAAPRLTKVIQPDSILPEEDYEEDEDEGAEGAEDAEGVESAEASDGEGEDTAERSEENGGRRRRRRRRRRNGERDGEPREARAEGDAPETDDEPAAAAGDGEAQGETDGEAEDGEDDERGDRRRRRRGRRGGRRNRREGEDAPLSASGEDEGQDEAGDEAVAGSEDRPAVSDDSEIPVVTTAATEDSPVVAHHAAPEAPVAAVAVPAPEPQAPAAAPPAAIPAPVAAAADAEPAPAPTRRRSTVREKAPVRVTPAAVVPQSEESEIPEAASAAALPESGAAPAEVAKTEVAPTELPAAASASEDTPASSEPTQEDASMPISDADFEAGSPAADTAAEATPAAPSADAAEKRRSGWWQRKLFGG